MPEQDVEKAHSGWTLKGWHVLLALVLFFGATIVVNAYFTFKAVQSFPGEDVKRSYRQGLEYNEILDARAAQAELGWTAKVNTVAQSDGTKLLILIADTEGEGVSGLTMNGVLRHNTDTSLDRDLTFIPVGRGKFEAELGAVSTAYRLQGRAVGTVRGEVRDFRFEYRF